MRYEFHIPLPIYSMNSLYAIHYNTRKVKLRKEAGEWKQRAKRGLPRMVIPDGTVLRLGPVWFHGNWWFKNGEPRKLDVHNGVKILVDAICEKGRVDDSWVWEVGPFIKVQDEEEGIRGVLERI